VGLIGILLLSFGDVLDVGFAFLLWPLPFHSIPFRSVLDGLVVVAPGRFVVSVVFSSVVGLVLQLQFCSICLIFFVLLILGFWVLGFCFPLYSFVRFRCSASIRRFIIFSIARCPLGSFRPSFFLISVSSSAWSHFPALFWLLPLPRSPEMARTQF
jgi:hypothetical protein